MDLPWIKAFMDTRRTEAAKIQAKWSSCSRPGEAEIKRAALLAWEGSLTSVVYMQIKRMSITDIPRDHMEKLASIVTWRVHIDMMTHTDQLGSILASVKCTDLLLWRIALSEAETQALVTAMRDRVVYVMLGYVTLDIEQLTQYNGKGSCSELEVWGDKRTSYGERLRRWAADKGWKLTGKGYGRLVMKRI